MSCSQFLKLQISLNVTDLQSINPDKAISSTLMLVADDQSAHFRSWLWSSTQISKDKSCWKDGQLHCMD